jgi:hypothetical protein
MIEALAFAVVVLTGLYFMALAGVSFFQPALANRFLHGFAASALAHYAELFLRLLAGGAFVLHAPRMLLSQAFSLFGWVLLVTTALLLLVPWRWHHRFAQLVVPRASGHITLLGLASLAIGGLILAAVARDSAA